MRTASTAHSVFSPVVLRWARRKIGTAPLKAVFLVKCTDVTLQSLLLLLVGVAVLLFEARHLSWLFRVLSWAQLISLVAHIPFLRRFWALPVRTGYTKTALIAYGLSSVLGLLALPPLLLFLYTSIGQVVFIALAVSLGLAVPAYTIICIAELVRIIRRLRTEQQACDSQPRPFC